MATRERELGWLGHLRAIALLWIILNHVVERIAGFPLIANPSEAWPPLAERIAQLAPLSGYGLWDAPLNLLRYLGWLGDQGVQLFLIASGFGLTWGLLERGVGRIDLRDFYWRRAMRILPHYWAAHLLFLVLALATPAALWLTQPGFWLSLSGLRLTPGSLYYFSPSWWYITLILQLYLVFPMLWWGLRRVGPLRFLLACCAVAFAARLVGLYWFGGYIDAWQRGAFFLTRLPEFAFGMALTAWIRPDPTRADRHLRSVPMISAALAGWLGGIGLALTRPGMVIAPFVLGVSAFVLLYALVGGVRAKVPSGAWGWLSQRSFALFLTHHPPILLLVFPESGALRIAAQVLLALLVAALLAELLDRGVAAALAGIAGLRQRHGAVRTALVGAGALTLLIGGLLGAELLVGRFDPQEYDGWGERVALEADETLGYKMRPDGSFRLRWESYDYTATTSALGFPSPAYPEEKRSETLRIMTVGDAFTSAEGVDTALAWPRLLEAQLSAQGRPAEVLNFAVTGYGPNQYAALAAQYAPTYHPDLLVVGLFVNDYQDALTSNAEFQEQIGLSRPPSLARDTLRLANLRRFTQKRLYDPLVQLLSGRPDPYGYTLGHFATMEVGRSEVVGAGRAAVAARLAELRDTARAAGSEVLVVLIPSGPQVCGPADLAYYPQHVDLGDAARYDIDQPQRVAGQIAGELGLASIDLRPALQAAETCVYQPHNMHWLPEGHQIAASEVAAWIGQR